MIQDIKTQSQYINLCDFLTDLLSSCKESVVKNGRGATYFRDQLNNKTSIVSQSNDGFKYGIVAGQFYPYGVLKNICERLKREGKDLPVFHSSLESLEYHVGYIIDKDFRFINGIYDLPVDEIKGGE